MAGRMIPADHTPVAQGSTETHVPSLPLTSGVISGKLASVICPVYFIVLLYGFSELRIL